MQARSGLERRRPHVHHATVRVRHAYPQLVRHVKMTAGQACRVQPRHGTPGHVWKVDEGAGAPAAPKLAVKVRNGIGRTPHVRAAKGVALQGQQFRLAVRLPFHRPQHSRELRPAHLGAPLVAGLAALGRSPPLHKHVEEGRAAPLILVGQQVHTSSIVKVDDAQSFLCKRLLQLAKRGPTHIFNDKVGVVVMRDHPAMPNGAKQGATVCPPSDPRMVEQSPEHTQQVIHLCLHHVAGQRDRHGRVQGLQRMWRWRRRRQRVVVVGTHCRLNRVLDGS
mmetsp:Transcript_3249/g.10684  ORF Transcript_3249/g.10684 Transcript_3249/m.10684 type:complete len:278 (-) Transcript_3249:225-1058(-)